MPSWLLPLLAGLAGAYVLLLGALWAVARRHPDPPGLRALLRLLPDVVRTVRRLAADGSLPRGLRLRLALLLAYLVCPVDLVPDVVPVLGWADDALLVAVTLRAVLRAAGPDALRRHWPGTPEGLAVVERLCAPRRP